jgi:hypothetical protein
MCIRGSFSGNEAAQREAIHTSIFPAAHNEWSSTCTPPYVLMAWYLIIHRNNLTLNIYFSDKLQEDNNSRDYFVWEGM